MSDLPEPVEDLPLVVGTSENYLLNMSEALARSVEGGPVLIQHAVLVYAFHDENGNEWVGATSTQNTRPWQIAGLLPEGERLLREAMTPHQPCDCGDE